MTVLGIIIGLLILNLIVVAHEFGHYIAAKKNGVIVEEFAIGFPPRAWSKKLKSGLIISINWLPIGGFCRLKGENDTASKKGDYGKATFAQKTKILFAGVAMNWLLSIVIFTTLALVGLPRAVPNQFSVASDTKEVYGPALVSHIVEGSPAEKTGLAYGDEIVSLDNQKINRASQVTEISRANSGKEIEVTFKRGDVVTTAKTTLRDNNDDNKGYLGVGTFQNEYTKSTWSAPIVGVGATIQLTAETFKGVGKTAADFFGGLFKQLSFNDETRKSGQESIGVAGESVAGPVGIIGVIFPQATQSGFTTLMFLAGIISLSLAVMNVLPIPALDGGRWFLTVLFKMTKKPLTEEIEGKINAVGFIALMGLIVLITIVDVTRFF
jgi:Predicted membrane-associated Zn-dependent proteases 1